MDNALGEAQTIVLLGGSSDIGRAIGGLATELFEIRDSTRRAGTDHRVGLDDPRDD